MPLDIALLTEAPTPWNSPAVAIASLAAYLRAGAPAAQVTLHLLQDGQQDALELELFRRNARWLGVWMPPDSTGGLERLLARLKPVMPDTRIILMGPLLTGQIDAGRLVTHVPDAELALWGEPEAALLELIRLTGRSSVRRWVEIPGVSARSGERILHATRAPSPLDPADLPSPYQTGALPLPGRNSPGIDLELQRSAIPFSPLAPALLAAPPRPIPLERLKGELELLLEAGVPLLRLIGGSADLAPGHLRAVLEMIAAGNSRTAVQLELATIPDPDLGAMLGDAGVARIDLRDPAGGPLDQGGGPFLDRIGLRHLIDQGIQISIRIPIGRPGDTKEAIRRRIDYYLTVPDVQLRLEPVRLWPGHPLRALPSERPQAGLSQAALVRGPALRVAGPPTFQVLETADLSFEEALELRQWIPLLEALHGRHEATLRLLARAVEVSPISLLERLAVQSHESGGAEVDATRRLTAFVRETLREAGKLDRLPVLEALMELERWCDAPPRSVPPFKSREYDVDFLDDVVMARAPGLEMRTFAYHLLGLLSSSRVEDTPLRRTHIALRRQGFRRPLLSTVNDLQLGLFEQVDGRRTVGEIIGGSSLRPGDAVGNAAVSSSVNEEELRHGLISLLSQGYIYVRRHEAKPPIDLVPSGKGRILSFRIGHPRREVRPPDEEM